MQILRLIYDLFGKLNRRDFARHLALSIRRTNVVFIGITAGHIQFIAGHFMWQ